MTRSSRPLGVIAVLRRAGLDARHHRAGAIDDLDRATGDAGEQSGFARRAPRLEPERLRRVARNRAEANRAAQHAHADAIDRAGVSAIESVGDAQDGGEAAHLVAMRSVERLEVPVLLPRARPAVIARDVGDD